MVIESIPVQKRAEAFVKLGELLAKTASGSPSDTDIHHEALNRLHAARELAGNHNPWFVPESIDYCLTSWSAALTEDKITKWLWPYRQEISAQHDPLTIAVIMAGNIPMVGFHDFISVLISGNRFLGKLSGEDPFLLPAVAGLLCSIEPSFSAFITFTDDKPGSFDAVIATGSNNTSRYFNYYFGRYPNIIRMNRNSIAVLTGEESEAETARLADDIFLYFGLGCRNVSMIYIPENYDFSMLVKTFISKYSRLGMHHKYMNNYTYQRTILMMNNIPFIDGEFFLLVEKQAFISPVSVIHYYPYRGMKLLMDQLESEKENIQCIVGNPVKIPGSIAFGKSQQPELWDYADNVDTMEWLINLSNHH